MQLERLTAVRAGKGRDLVVLHSLLADRHAFDPVLPPLEQPEQFLAAVKNFVGL